MRRDAKIKLAIVTASRPYKIPLFVKPSLSRDGGAKGSRTPDLLNAIQALSQLSYGPLYPPNFSGGRNLDLAPKPKKRKGTVAPDLIFLIISTDADPREFGIFIVFIFVVI